VIQEITTQTSAGTGATAQSIGNLAEMALDLRESVAGFKLPEEESDTVGFGRSQDDYADAGDVAGSELPYESEDALLEDEDFDSAATDEDFDDSEVIDLDDEVMPEDDASDEDEKTGKRSDRELV